MENDREPANILMVDDQAANLVALEAVLEPLGCNLVKAHSGQEALRWLLSHDCAVILLDVQMPVLNGFETAGLIKEREKSSHIPIIFITAANQDENSMRQGYAAGAVDYILKPFGADILKAKVAVFVELFQRGEEIKRQSAGRGEADRELTASEAYLSEFKSTLDATLDGVFMFDAQSLHFSYINLGGTGQLGYGREEILTLTPFDILSETDAATLRDKLTELRDGTLASYTFQTQQRRKDGSEVPVEVFMQFVAPERGAGRFVAVARDITERKQAEAAVRQAQRLAQATVDALPENIAVLDGQGKIIAVNAAWQAFTQDKDFIGATASVGDDYLKICATSNSMVGDAVATGIRAVLAGDHELFCLEYACPSPREEHWFQVGVTRFTGDGALHAVVAHEDITVRKHALALLLASEASLDMAQHSAHLGSWELDLANLNDLNSNPLRWSDEVFRIFGYQPGEIAVSNDNFLRAVHPDDRDRITKAMTEAIQRGESYSLDHRILLPDGTERVVYELASFSLDASGKPLKLLGTVQDITERKRAEEELRLREQRLTSIYNTSADVLFYLQVEAHEATLQYRFLSVNQAFSTITGLGYDQVVGKLVAEVIPEPSASLAQEKYQAAIQAKGIIRWEEVSEYPTGRLIGEVSVAPVFDEQGNCTHLVGAVHDVTQARQIAQELQEQEQFQDTLLENFPNGSINVFDRDLRYVLAAGSGLEQSGLAPAQLVGKTLEEVFLPEAVAQATSYYRRVLDGETVEFEQFFNGRVYCINAAPLRDQAGTVTNVLAVAQDITARKRAEALVEESAREQRELAAQLETERSRLVAAQQVAKVGSWETNLSSMEVIWSHETHRIFETDPAKFQPTHQGFLELVHPADRAAVDEAFVRSQGQSVACAIEHRVLLSDDRTKFVEERWQAFFDEQKNPVRAVGTCQDITERKLAEQSLRESEARFSGAFEYAPIGVALVALDGQWLQVNQAVCDVVGYPEAELLTRSFQEITHPDDLEDDLENLRRLLAGEMRSYQMEKRYFHARGHLVTVLLNVSLVRDSQGQPLYFISQIQDITERKQTEGLLLKNQQRLALATESAHIGIWDWDVVANKMDWDAQMYALYGIQEQDFLGAYAAWQNGLHPEDRAEAEATLHAALEGSRDFDTQFRVVWPTGEERTIEAHALVLRADDGSAQRMIGVNWDITERKQAEEALQEAESKYRSIFENAIEGIFQTTLGGQYLSANPALARLYGYDSAVEMMADITNIAGQLYVEPGRRDEFIRLMNEQEQVTDFESLIRRKDGSVIWIQENARTVRDAAGRLLGYEGTVMDITKRKQAEAERDRFFTLSLDMLAIIGSDGYMKRLNPAFAITLGFADAELMAVPFLEFVHPDDIPATLAEIAKLNNGVAVLSFENRYRCRDGSYKWLRWMTAPFEELWYCVAHDVTSIKQAEAALVKANEDLELRVARRTESLERANVALQVKEAEQRQIMATLTQSEERFRLLVESVHDYAIFMVDATGHVMTWNTGAERMKGYRAEDIIGHHFSCFFTAEDQAAGKPEQELRIAAAKGYLDNEGRRVRRDGSQFWATAVITALRDDSGQLRGFAKIIRDITERKNVEAALHEAKAQADAANLAKSEFLSRMSHELRTPLNAILGFGQILDRQDLAPQSKESVGYILNGGRHLLSLINEVLDIARVEAGRLELSLEPIALDDIVPEACALMRPLAGERHIQLDENTAHLGSVYILADRQRLKQVLINLLSNAIKYNREGGQVEVSCTPGPDGHTTIAVRDTGPGIAPADLTKLFTPFERLNAGASNIEGTGLGLVLSQRLMSAMGGTLTVSSDLGTGTTFTLALPQAAAPEESLTNVPEAMHLDTDQAAGRTYTVLCIEDNPSNLRLVEAILQGRPDITLLTAIQGSIGLDLARQHEPDLILLDLNLPDIQGPEVLVRLQQSALTRDIPVVVLSADATSHQIERLLAAGAKAYLTKPLDVGLFLNTLDALLQVTP